MMHINELTAPPSMPRPRSRATLRRARQLVVLASIIAGATAAPLDVPMAAAATGDLVCTTNAQLNFSPPLTPANTTAQVSATSGFVNCTSLNGAYTYLKSATAIASGTATSAGGLNPCSLLLSVDLPTARAHWSPNGQVSTLTVVVNTNPSAGAIALGGKVTGGPLKGDSLAAYGAAVPNADCALNGLSSLALPLTVATFS